MNKLTPATRQLLALVAVLGAPLMLMGSAATHPQAGTVTQAVLWLVSAAALVILAVAAWSVARDLRK